jgi:hypothetical protein
VIVTTTDRICVAVGLLGVVVAAIAFLPPSEYARAFSTTGAAWFLAFLIAPRLPFDGPLGLEIIFVTFAAIMIIMYPTFPASGGRGGSATAVAAAGVQITVLFWAALRWRPLLRRPRERVLFRDAVQFGLFGAAFFSVIATIPILIAVVSDWNEGRVLLWTYPAYFGGALSATAIFWVLQGLRETATGRYILGLACGSVVYLAVAPIVAALRAEPLGPAMWIVGYMCGAVIGPAISLSWEGAI